MKKTKKRDLRERCLECGHLAGRHSDDPEAPCPVRYRSSFGGGFDLCECNGLVTKKSERERKSKYPKAGSVHDLQTVRVEASDDRTESRKVLLKIRDSIGTGVTARLNKKQALNVAAELLVVSAAAYGREKG